MRRFRFFFFAFLCIYDHVAGRSGFFFCEPKQWHTFFLWVHQTKGEGDDNQELQVLSAAQHKFHRRAEIFCSLFQRTSMGLCRFRLRSRERSRDIC
ncbi:hypothetical protein PVAP13_2KG400300 [Panicum virgatum]|uniref:Secreted protein n=1 Tax=Panicum virgatum TaxID=38727 RepID=A0A8T0W427_PANVG|nr:hypothetical protein PVAP13_2KG400300 [Panicum virgatum]